MESILTEENSVSQTVKQLVNEVLDDIKTDLKRQPYYISEDFNIKFKEHKIELTFKHINKKLSDITLEYTLYIPENEKAYEYFTEVVNPTLNSSYDDKKKLLYIVGGCYKGNILEDTVDVLFHELTHYYQYEMDMKKRTDLYSVMEEYLKQGRKNIDAYYVGLALYYSFPHEQDAYAQQYYSILMNSDKDVKLEDFFYYKKALNAYQIVTKKINKDILVNLVKDLGFKGLRFYIRKIKYGIDRFYRKLKNARMAAFADKRFQKLTEEQIINYYGSRFADMMLLEEEEKRKIFKHEKFMNFNRQRLLKR